MNTRTIIEIQVFVLILNNMRDSQIEMQTPVVGSYDKQTLIDWYKEQLTESWVDEEIPGGKKWGKRFKKGSKLEWYNTVWDIEQISSYGHGIQERWLTQDMIDHHNLQII